jgi:large exoprotein involved in heme utilization and adhesion
VNAKDSLGVSGNALIVTDSLGFGRGGDIFINAGNITVTGVGADTAAIKAQTALAGDAGHITIHADGTINLQNGGQIAGTTIGSGTGSNLVVSAGKGITFTGADSRIVNATGPAPVDQLNQIFTLAFGSSFEDLRDLYGLPVSASVFDVLGAFLNDLGFTPMPALTPGNAGTVSIATPLLTLNAGTRIEMSTGWEGNAGALTASVGSLFVNDGAAISSRSGIERLTGEAVLGTGNAGTVNITATDTISISGRSPTTGAGSSISTTTFGEGTAGDISLSAKQVNVQNGGRVASESGGVLGGVVHVGMGPACESGGCSGGNVAISATDAITVSGQDSVVSTSTFGDGNGGNVMLNSGSQVSILDGGRVSADSGGPLGGSVVSGTGLAGNITITSGNEIYLNNGSITTQALTADGGNITLMAPNMVQLQDSVISTSVAGGLGQGGNILIDPQFVIVNNSSIIANAFGGPGGNITIVANNFLQSTTSVIEASSALSTPGTISIQSPENNVESSIAQLPAAFLDAASLLRGLCTARRTGARSSFAVAGRGGVPVDADGYLPSFGTDTAASLASTDLPVQSDAGHGARPHLAVALLMPDDLDCLR